MWPSCAHPTAPPPHPFPPPLPPPPGCYQHPHAPASSLLSLPGAALRLLVEWQCPEAAPFLPPADPGPAAAVRPQPCRSVPHPPCHLPACFCHPAEAQTALRCQLQQLLRRPLAQPTRACRVRPRAAGTCGTGCLRCSSQAASSKESKLNPMMLGKRPDATQRLSRSLACMHKVHVTALQPKPSPATSSSQCLHPTHKLHPASANVHHILVD